MRILYTFLLFCSFTFALNITNDPTFQKLIGAQENKDKLVLMFYSAKTCPQCAYMKQKVFKQNDVHQFMQKHFSIMYKDINTDELPKGFEYFGIPTMFFIDHNGNQVAKIVGSSRAEPFLEELKKIQGKM